MDTEKDYLIKTLNELKDAVEEGDKNKIQDIINWFHKNLERNIQLLKLVTSGSQCITQTDLIIAVCRTRGKEAVTIFNLLKEYDILDQLSGANFHDPEVKKQRTEAFKHALELDTFCMVEILYEYWCGDLYWIVKSPQSIETHEIIKKIETLGESLEDARIVIKVENKTRLIEIHSLITFNTFQHKLYSSLLRRGSIKSPEDTATMLIDVLSIYEHYSDLKKVRLPLLNQRDELKLKASLDDVTSIRQKSLVNMAYEVYFQKLDFNVAWLIMENSFVLKNYLKKRFNKPTRYFTENPEVENFYRNEVSLYKESESGLFHYIYRTYEKWRLYIPTNSQTTENTDYTVIHNGKKTNQVIKYNEVKLLHAPLLFLERENFKKCLNNLKRILEKHVISEDPANNEENGNCNTKTTLLDDNYLTATMYMSDYYSLKKIVYYIEAIEGTNGIHVLMIERALQVIGEMLKKTESSNHIMESTKSLLHIAISVETLKYIHDIREFLSHANKGRVSKRINIAKDEQQMFAQIKKDLIFIKTKIDLVLAINKYIFDKSLLEKGLHLLDERIKTWPVKKSSHVDDVYEYIEKHGEQSSSDPYLQERTGLGNQLLKEIHQLVNVRIQIEFTIQSAKTRISDKVDSFLLKNIGNIRQTLQLLTDNQTYVKQINPQLHNLCESNANVLSINDHGENNTVVTDLETLNKIKDFSSHSDHITTMLSFCFNNSQLLATDDTILQVNVNDKDIVENILSKLESKKGNKKYTSAPLENYSFSGLKKLHNISENTKATNDCRIVRQELIKCLISRVNLLKETFGYPQHIPEIDITPSFQHLQRFKSDKKFRLELEIILADIGNILKSCKIKKNMIKSAKLQRDIDLRNVLHHGNPFIEVIGDVFDTYDFPRELLSKALMFANDGLFIEALFKLFQDNIPVRTIRSLENREINKLDDDLKAFYNQFQHNSRWNSYLKLIKTW